MASAVDLMNEAIDGIVDLYRAEMGSSPERHEIYALYRLSMEGRMFADDERAMSKTQAHRVIHSHQLSNRAEG